MPATADNAKEIGSPWRDLYRWHDGRATVSRYEVVLGDMLTICLASNWKALEGDAIEAVEAHGGAVNLSGHYPCPATLARRAEFPSDDIPDDLISLSEAAVLAYPTSISMSLASASSA
jgi:hypothetical protein